MKAINLESPDDTNAFSFSDRDAEPSKEALSAERNSSYEKALSLIGKL